ncbi:collagen alpha-2(I) chain-like [Emydura macquarii macquarii]|uniref:collagen alpha-2(I) chain-like n=1 Tax=Emydura macquarii macquarii TaxID=1129001 RepID=UPI00352A76F7
MDAASWDGGVTSQPGLGSEGGSVTRVPSAPGSGLLSEHVGTAPPRPSESVFPRRRIRLLRQGKGALSWEPGATQSCRSMETNHEHPIPAVRPPASRAAALGSGRDSVPGSTGSSLLRKLLCFKAASPGRKVPPCHGEGAGHRPIATLSGGVAPLGEAPLRWRQRADSPSPGRRGLGATPAPGGARPRDSWGARPWQALQGLIAARTKRGVGPSRGQRLATEAARGAERDGGDAETQRGLGELTAPGCDDPGLALSGAEREGNAGPKGKRGGGGVVHGGLGAQEGEGTGPQSAPSLSLEEATDAELGSGWRSLVEEPAPDVGTAPPPGGAAAAEPAQGQEGARAPVTGLASQGERGQQEPAGPAVEMAAGNPGWGHHEGAGARGSSTASRAVGGRPVACAQGDAPKQRQEQGTTMLAPSTDAAEPRVTPSQGEPNGHGNRPPPGVSRARKAGSPAPNLPPAGVSGNDALAPLTEQGAGHHDAAGGSDSPRAYPLEQPALGRASLPPAGSAWCHGEQDQPEPPASLAPAPAQVGAMDQAEAAGGSGVAQAPGTDGACQPSEGAPPYPPSARVRLACPGGSVGALEEQGKRLLYAAAAEIVTAAIDAAARQVARKQRVTSWAGSKGSTEVMGGLHCA